MSVEKLPGTRCESIATALATWRDLYVEGRISLEDYERMCDELLAAESEQ